jgi:hypothetical protein
MHFKDSSDPAAVLQELLAKVQEAVRNCARRGESSASCRGHGVHPTQLGQLLQVVLPYPPAHFIYLPAYLHPPWRRRGGGGRGMLVSSRYITRRKILT